MCGNNCNGIAHTDAVVSAWDNNLAVAVNKGNQQILLKRQVGQTHICNRRLLTDTELNSFRLGIKDVIQSLDVASPRRALRTNTGNYRLRGKLSWINHASKIEVIKHRLEGHSINLGNNLGLGYLARIQRQHHVLLINSGERHKGLRSFDTLFL